MQVAGRLAGIGRGLVAAGLLLTLAACGRNAADSGDAPGLATSTRPALTEDDMRALFREEVKPRLARYPEVGAYNQEI